MKFQVIVSLYLMFFIFFILVAFGLNFDDGSVAMSLDYDELEAFDNKTKIC